MIALRYSMAALLVLAVAASARHHHQERSTEVESDPTPAPVQEREPETRRHRKKRWYSNYGYQQPAYRDDGPPMGPNPYDPFAYIFKRLDELAALVRQPLAPQTPILVPYPVYLPACGCPTAGGAPSQPTPANFNGTTNPSLDMRFGEDKENDDYDDMPLRPINFDPVVPDRPLSRPIPGVEHGSTQAGASPTGQQGREPGGFALPAAVAPGAGSSQPSPVPSRCDFAVLTCCHQRYTTNQCFQTLGCPSALRGGDPCDTRALNNVVGLFQDYYRKN